MGLESTIICVDNSDFMRNGDFLPTRLQAQQDAVNLVCHSKTRANPENNVGLLTMSSVEVLVTLTTDAGRILSKLHQVQPKGEISFVTSVKVAHLALKHRQGRNHKMRIVAFVGSPVHDDEKDQVKLAKKLKKEKVNVDIINFGEQDENTDTLTNFINTINGKDGTGSHLVTVPAGPTSMLSDALLNSPVIVGEDGAGANIGGPGFEFGFDANEDPELALALRVSMEEQRARQEDEAKKAAAASVAETGTKTGEGSNEETLLEQAIAMSMQQNTPPAAESPMPDLSVMSEEQQIAYAMQMSLQAEADDSSAPMEIDLDKNEKEKQKEEKEKDEAKGGDDDYSDVMSDPEFLQSVLSNLPGVDPNSEAIRNAMSSITKKDSSKKDDKKDAKDKDKK